MAWIELHQTLRNHPKLYSGARHLSVLKPQLAGHLIFIWLWAMDYAMDGDLSRYSNQQIADAAEWPGDADKFVEEVTKAGFLEENRHIHDWLDFCGEIVLKRLARKNERRANGVRLAPKNAETRPTQPNLTQPNQHLRAEALVVARPTTRAVPFQEFLNCWNSNCGTLPKATELSSKRKQRIRHCWLAKPSMAYWQDVISRLSRSSFCQGKSSSGWRASFDFLVANDNNHLKVMEGKYDDHGTNDSKSTVDFKAEFRANRAAEKARANASSGTLFAGVRDSEELSGREGRRDTGGADE